MNDLMTFSISPILDDALLYQIRGRGAAKDYRGRKGCKRGMQLRRGDYKDGQMNDGRAGDESAKRRDTRGYPRAYELECLRAPSEVLAVHERKMSPVLMNVQSMLTYLEVVMMKSSCHWLIDSATYDQRGEGGRSVDERRDVTSRQIRRGSGSRTALEWKVGRMGFRYAFVERRDVVGHRSDGGRRGRSTLLDKQRATIQQGWHRRGASTLVGMPKFIGESPRGRGKGGGGIDVAHRTEWRVAQFLDVAFESLQTSLEDGHLSLNDPDPMLQLFRSSSINIALRLRNRGVEF